MKLYAILLLISINFIRKTAQDRNCRNFGYDSVACVCDEKHRENINPRLPKYGEYLLVTSNKKGLRFATSYGIIHQNECNISYQCTDLLNDDSAVLIINKTETAQKIIGFGGTITDAVGINLNKVSSALQNQILHAYFSHQGLKYNIAKTTIGHCDYSESEYYYNDSDYDIEMKNWTLADEDFQNKIPFIQRAQDMVGKDFHLISSMWTVPYWMREKSDEDLRLRVIKKYYYSYCLYIIKYLQAYRDQGIEFWGVSFANEPFINSNVPLADDVESIFTLWTMKRYADFAVNHFIPALSKDFSKVKLLFFEENRLVLLPIYIEFIQKQTELSKYMEVVALHSHLNLYISPYAVDLFRNYFPNVTIITTEHVYGVFHAAKLGSWSTAEYYARNMLQDLNHFHSAWVDWNMLLDTKGGPTIDGTFSHPLDSPIIVDAAKKVFYKQPSYYAIGHFSKFMPPGSVKIDVKASYPTGLQYAAVLTPDGHVVIVLFNMSNKYTSVIIKDTKGDIRVNLTPNSINTLIF